MRGDRETLLLVSLHFLGGFFFGGGGGELGDVKLPQHSGIRRPCCIPLSCHVPRRLSTEKSMGAQGRKGTRTLEEEVVSLYQFRVVNQLAHR